VVRRRGQGVLEAKRVSCVCFNGKRKRERVGSFRCSNTSTGTVVDDWPRRRQVWRTCVVPCLSV
jgi:hypothetical protein